MRDRARSHYRLLYDRHHYNMCPNKVQKIRHQTLINEVLSTIRDTKELSNGCQVEFPYDPSLFLKISEWMTLEHLCCPFFSFTLQLETDMIRLAITGSEEAKRFLQTWIGAGAIKREFEA